MSYNVGIEVLIIVYGKKESFAGAYYAIFGVFGG